MFPLHCGIATQCVLSDGWRQECTVPALRPGSCEVEALRCLLAGSCCTCLQLTLGCSPSTVVIALQRSSLKPVKRAKSMYAAGPLPEGSARDELPD